MMGGVSLGDAGATSALLVADAAGPAAPPLVSGGPRVGGQLQPPQLLSSVSLVYPPTARMQHIQGIVMLDAVVDETGKVVETTVLAGPGQLMAAAQESVRNWKYKPAQLNGKPIAVHTKVNVKFSLQ
jgi:protein TonB